jgi:hypothetical protein
LPLGGGATTLSSKLSGRTTKSKVSVLPVSPRLVAMIKRMGADPHRSTIGQVGRQDLRVGTVRYEGFQDARKPHVTACNSAYTGVFHWEVAPAPEEKHP